MEAVMPHILVVEDEADLRRILEYNLSQAGHTVRAVETAAAAMAAVRAQTPDLVLLDLMLPDSSGLDVCRALKADAHLRDIAILMLTARDTEVDRVVGFELGADDYVTKPFSVRELLLRIQAILRRSRGSVAIPTAEGSSVQTFGRLRMDPDAFQIWVDGALVALTPLEMRLLLALFERRGRVQTRSNLLEEVWNANPENNTRTVDTHVRRLREKLGPAGDYIETVRGIGYRFATDCNDNR
jgi:two-component system phosphate regulon response regulator PhoB